VTELVMLVPVLGRPHRVAPLLESIAATTTVEHRVLFIVDHDDHTEIAAITAAGAQMLVYPGSCPSKWNVGTRETTEPLIFYAADDLRFHSGWYEAAMARMIDPVQVVGVNDLCSARVLEGWHATHFLTRRAYAHQPTIDGQLGPMNTMYSHSFVDDEFVATARKRGVIAFAANAIVEHLHPDNAKAPMDDTYLKGRAHMQRDRQLYEHRCWMWM